MSSRETPYDSSSPWVLTIVVEIRPECVDEFLLLVSEVIDRMRLEPTFINTVVSADVDKPGRFCLFEIWQDRNEFFSVQLKRTYRRRYADRIEEISVVPRKIDEWRQIRADYNLRF